ncbi:MAG: PAS domain S-box protein [Haloferacaceae archaeon]
MTPDPPDAMCVLLVDDEPDLAELAATFLTREDDRFAVETASGPAAARAVLADRDVDCVVSDYDMPGENGLEFLEAVRAEQPDLPFILYTGKGSEEVASEAISAGVTDYLQKETGTSQYTVLANRITNAVEGYRTKREIAASQRRLSLFIEQSPLGVLEYNEDFEIVRLNERAEEILGYTEAALRGRTWEALVTEDSYENVTSITEKLADAAGGYHSIDENVRADGERIVCEWHNRVITDDDGAVVAIISLFQDITERRAQQEELERYRAVVQAATSAILTVDATGTIHTANQSVERLFGYAPEELVGEPLSTLIPEEFVAPHDAGFERYLETGERSIDWGNVEFPGQHRDGSTLPLSIAFGEVGYEGTRYFVGILRDVSEREARKRELAERNDRLEEFASVVSHDLRNPLGVAEGRLELAREEPIDEHFDAIERSLGRMRTLIEDLLTLAREDEEEPAVEPIDLGALATDCWETVETADATLQNTADRTLYANRSRLRQLVENLVRNSIEHGSTDVQSQAGGALEHGSSGSTRAEADPTAVTVTVGDLEDGFFIADDGPGIPPAEREAAFELGYSTSADGTGFGLGIVTQIVEAHGWEIDIVDDDAGRMRFEITGVAFADE